MDNNKKSVPMFRAPVCRAPLSRIPFIKIWGKISAVAAAEALYLLLFFLLHTWTGIAFGAVAIFPVVLAAIFFGIPGALVLALGNFPLNLILVRIFAGGGSETHFPPLFIGSSVVLVLGILAAYMRNLRIRLSAEKEEFEAAHTLLDEVVTNVQEGIGIVDEHERVEFCNPAFAAMYGLRQEEMLGRSILDFLQPKGRELVLEQTERRKGGENGTYEINIKTVSGKERTVRVSATPRFDSEGTYAGTFGILQDITAVKETESALKKSLEEKNYLIKEINHRVKNNLFMISSLLNLKSSETGDEGLFSDVQNQIKAIRLVHEKLYQTDDVSQIDFGSYTRDLLESIFTTFTAKPVHLENRTGRFMVSTKSAVTLGLIVNEVATNAIKHGFTEEEEGVFTIEVRREKSAGKIVLLLANSGRRFPDGVDFYNADSLGLRLIHALVAQLGGTVELERDPITTFIIKFPEAL